MNQYPIVDFLDEMGLFHEADFVEDQLVREASKKNYWPVLLPIANTVPKVTIRKNKLNKASKF